MWPVVLVLVVEEYFSFIWPINYFTYRLGYINAVSTGCWLTISTSEVTTVQISSLFCCSYKKANYDDVVLIHSFSIVEVILLLHPCGTGFTDLTD